MVKLQVQERVITNRKVELKVDRRAILDMLQAHGFQVPDSATVSIHVPGGGDWSDTELFLDEPEQAIRVVYEEVTER